MKDSFSEVGTSKASMNRTGKTNAAKGVHNNYNEYKDFSDRETEAHICAAFMEMSGMVTMDGNYVIFLFISKLPSQPLLGLLVLHYTQFQLLLIRPLFCGGLGGGGG